MTTGGRREMFLERIARDHPGAFTMLPGTLP